MYRSQGTASSPDLATLVRKAKERGTTYDRSKDAREQNKDPAPPLPSSSSSSTGTSTTRPRSSTQSPGTARLRRADHPVPASPTIYDWAGSPKPKVPAKDYGTIKPSMHNPKSMRSKTTAFFGRMLGQGTVRDRSQRMDLPSPTSLSSSMTIPALSSSSSSIPTPAREGRRLPIKSPVKDVFGDALAPTPTPNMGKPLPPIQNGRSTSDDFDADDHSFVQVEQPSQYIEDPPVALSSKTITKSTVRRLPELPSINATKRRSMSVSEFELKQAMAQASSSTPLPESSPVKDRKPRRPEEKRSWDSRINGMITDLKGELSQLESISSGSLDLKDPSTPARRAALHRAQTDSPTASSRRTTLDSLASSPGPSTPVVKLDPPASQEGAAGSQRSSQENAEILDITDVPPRTTSLQTPPRHRSGSNSTESWRHGMGKNVPRTMRSYTADAPSAVAAGNHQAANSRLRVQHRSAASSSEPSLISAGDEGGRTCKHRFVSPLMSIKAQHELAQSELSLNRYASNPSLGKSDETSGDMEARGKELAARCYREDETFLPREKIAEWLGGQSPINAVALRYYMDYFDFSGLRLDNAFRKLCGKLYLKAETQQVDRILEQFSIRYHECNPDNLFGKASVVHATTYSLLLLNTDLHVADLATRMSRSQFVRNTLEAILMDLRHERSPGGISTPDLVDDASSIRDGSDTNTTAGTPQPRQKRSGSIASWNSVTRDVMASPGASMKSYPVSVQGDAQDPASLSNSTASVPMGSGSGVGGGSSGMGSSSGVGSSSDGRVGRNSSSVSVVYNRAWEAEMEILLKDIYNAVKTQQILQPLGSSLAARSSTSSLTPGTPMMRHRAGGRQPDRLATLKRGSIRGLSTLLGAQAGVSPYSSNSSIDGRVSPSPSFASHEAFLAPTLGFASNLSHTIIREAQEDDDRSHHSQDSISTDISITDEELALLGAPWAKEGMLCRKHYWEATGKKSKSRNWMDVFVVIQKGELNMFVFGEHHGGGSSVVGGGNWLENAQPVGTIQLAHSLAHALPPPGYNRERPHCMVLTLANGGVYFFQAGTEELVNEWVSTCNYWAARQSKEPLAGGVSNMEYGWNRVVEMATHGRSMSEDQNTRENDTMSVRSGRSTRSKFGRKDNAATMRTSPWSDRVFINDWKPPMPSTVPSSHDEEAQLDALKKHVAALKNDLKGHNNLREPMTALYQPRSANATRAQNNWEKKSQYLLTEIVKYESYIESLQSAMALRLKKRGEKALDKALSQPDPSEEITGSKWKGYPDQETIMESEEPPATPTVSQHHHRRETAEGRASG
ncbi:hypothetical protein PUNSTDRAFT_83262 [Punctularia strigosozonata HHB-11173 SS5]|uniref:uncharacterized protein n=1 Tax=Punctularia strigosozonata (strain HHB-11173) TaxID=741275 RepID=UPI000441754F|nr:uncharacterized protein PUNSTDRAFT_83262 [Punctularia strigosozonata HHB-11173 SS5]EIN11586.1 hypothetical protein PUNSTDRAFT_83262 [Punctularia strigosozonata HHB-11173 SS5]